MIPKALRRPLEVSAVAFGLIGLFAYGAISQLSRSTELRLRFLERDLGSRASERAAHLTELRRASRKALAVLAPRSDRALGQQDFGDAGAKLNRRVRWNEPVPNEAAESAKGFSVYARDAYRLSTLSRRISGARDWPSLHPWVDHAAFDFQWMRELRDYSRWEAERAEPIRRALARGESEPSRFPAPDFDQFVLWGKLRLLNGIHENQLADAVLDERALARLAYASELPGSTEAAARLLIAEVEAEQFSRTSLHRRVSADYDLAESARALLELGSQGQEILNPLAPAQSLAVAFKGDLPWPGACAFLNRSFSRLARARFLLGDRNPALVASIDGWISQGAASGCRIPYFRRLWGVADYVPEALQPENLAPLQLKSRSARTLVALIGLAAEVVPGASVLSVEFRMISAFRRAEALRELAPNTRLDKTP